MKTIALITAAGRGERFGGDIPKQFRIVNGRPLLSWTINCFEQAVNVDEIVIVVGEEFLLYTNEKVVNPYLFKKVIKIVSGGETRTDSVRKGLKSLPISSGFVAIHDGARPLVDPGDIDRVIETAWQERAAILASQATDTVKRVEGNLVLTTLDRQRIFLAETPQAFQYDIIMSAYEKNKGISEATDDAYFVEKLGFKVRIVKSDCINLKVTKETDLLLVRSVIESKYGTEV